MKIKVIMFAAAREALGGDSVVVDVEEPACVIDLKKTLVAKHPEAASIIERSAFSVDQQYAVDETAIDGSMEIAMIPPVSGG